MFDHYRAVPLVLAAGASQSVDCSARAVFMPDCTAALKVQADDSDEFTVNAGFFGRVTCTRRLRFRNAGAVSVTATAILSNDPDFLCMQPGSAGAATSLTDATLWDAIGHGHYRIRPFDTIPALLHGSGTSSSSLTSPELVLTANGPFGDRWAGERTPLDIFAGSGSVPATWNRAMRHRCIVMPILASGATVDSWIGIGLGGYSGVPPYPTVGAGVVNAVLLYMRPNVPSWELYVGRGTSKASKTTLAGVTPPTIGFFDSFELEVRYEPGASVKAYVNGTLGATVTDPTVLPDPSIFADPLATFFVTAGSNVGSQTQAEFQQSVAAMFGFPGLT